jgi:hypothetical protein
MGPLHRVTRSELIYSCFRSQWPLSETIRHVGKSPVLAVLTHSYPSAAALPLDPRPYNLRRNPTGSR